MEIATLGGGCFWCLDAVFRELSGVSSVVSGYSGGHTANPDYESVCSGRTGHAEAVQVSFDPAVISYETILEIFFSIHDPTTANRQGNDIGTQYRSVVFTHSDAQKAIAESMTGAIAGCVTEVVPFEKFHPAEDYHQDYLRHNESSPYCLFVVSPKVNAFRMKFPSMIKG